jgi:peptide/nickel transport system ATP-binding protein
LLCIEGLSVSIGGSCILNDLSLRVREGEILGLVGASGSGKSMTALAILRLLPAAASVRGVVRLRGETLTSMTGSQMRAVRGRQIGMVFQEPMTALNPLMRIGDQVAETVRVHRRVSANEARRAARQALDEVGLSGEQGALDRLPYELSGGQRQRVAIAMAMVMAPALLIADEPTTALDVITQAQVLVLLQDLVRRRGLGCLLITHDLAVVSQVCDRVEVMQSGEIVEGGATAALIRDARHPITRALLAAASLTPKPRVAARPVSAAGGATAGGTSAGSAGAAPSRVVLEARAIVQEYPTQRRSLWRAPAPLRALDGVSLSVHAGETVGLVGESGSGKSSLLRVLLALQTPRSGQVHLLGEAFSTARGATLRRLRRAIQGVFQDPYGSFDPRWTVRRLIAEPFFLLDSPPPAAEIEHRVAAVLEQVGLRAGDAARLPREFSGGQRQRIAIARALITQPAVIVFDEAVSALDVLVRAQILALLAELSSRLGLAYLFVTHDLHVIRAIADRIYVMRHGTMVEDGATRDIFDSPRHPYTRALIEATPVLRASPLPALST